MNSSNGFTLVELITILVILGVLAAVAVPRLTGLNDYRALEFRDRTVAALRYAQKTAVSHRRMVCVTFTATTVTLSIDATKTTTACGSPLNLPDQGTNVLTSADPVAAKFTSGYTDFNFLPDGTGANRTLTIAGLTDISVVGATGHVQ